MIPNEKPTMTEFSTETTTRSRVPTWPTKVCVMAPSEYWRTKVKIAGVARYPSFFDSISNWRNKSFMSLIRGMSLSSPVKWTLCVWFLEVRSGASALLSIDLPESTHIESQGRSAPVESRATLTDQCVRIDVDSSINRRKGSWMTSAPMKTGCVLHLRLNCFGGVSEP